jgi:DNA uptake protein ComE-like DNA-binding protein
MRVSIALVAVLSSTAPLAGCADPNETEPVAASRGALLTTEDVDVAVECQGIITYANWASFENLDYVLPAATAQNIIDARTIHPFETLADLSAVSGVGPATLQLIFGRAATYDFIDADCNGIYEEIALSHDDAANLRTYVNTVSEEELTGVLAFLIGYQARDAILAARPYTTVQQIADTAYVGPVTFRALRNAANMRGPFEVLAQAVNDVHADVVILRWFDWQEVLASDTGHLTGQGCYGVDPELMVPGAEIITTPFDGEDVVNVVTGAVSYADRFDGLALDPAAGLADLEARVDGHTFFGCYISIAPNPWCGINRTFFVDEAGGFTVFVETSWCE